MKSLINIKNNGNKWYLWCHVRHLNLVKRHPDRITREDKIMINDFECIFKEVKINVKNNGSYTEKYQDHVPCSFAYKVVCVDNIFSKKDVLYRGKNAVYKFIEAILKEYDYCKKMIKKHFNKNLIMSSEEEKS